MAQKKNDEIRKFMGLALASNVEARINRMRASYESRVESLQNAINKRASEAYEQGFNDGNDEPPDGALGLRSYGYNKISGGGREPELTFEENLNTAWALTQSNPVIRRGERIKRDYIVGGGISFSTPDEALQEILDKFWIDNHMDMHISEFAMQWSRYGAQVLPAYVRNSDGFVTIAYFDPSEIEEVITHPENSMDMRAVVLKERQPDPMKPWLESMGNRVYRIIRKCNDDEYKDLYVTAGQTNKDGEIEPQAKLELWEREMLEHYNKAAYDGDVFYWRKNTDSNQPIGQSDYIQMYDYATLWDETVWALAEREAFAGYFSFDVEVDGSEDIVRKRRSEITKNPPTRRGMVNVHNPQENWNMFAPDLKQQGSTITADLLLDTIWGGMGFPRAWFTQSTGTHLATAQAQGDPTWRSLAHDQGLIQKYIQWMLEFVRDQSYIGGTYNRLGSKEELADITVVMPEMTTRDVATISTALTSVVAALIQSEDAGYISIQDAREAFSKVIAELGVDVDISAMPELDDGANEAKFDARSWRKKKARQTTDSYFDVHAPLGEEKGGENEGTGVENT